MNACSKGNTSNIVKKSDQLNTSDNNTLIQVAEVNTVIDPITIEVLQNNQKMIIKLTGLAIPEFKENQEIYISSLNFTKFHLYKGKEVRLQKDIYDTNLELQLRYLFIDGELYNKLMLINGYAVVSDIHQQFELKQEFQSLEQKAQDSNLGYWSNQNGKLNNPNGRSKNSETSEPAGTLPKLNLPQTPTNICDYTDNNIPVIKGNYDKTTQIKTYYLPDSIFYKTIDMNPDDGDKLFCTESEAEINEWTKSKH